MSLQLSCSKMLLDVARAAVKDPHKSFLVEAGHLCLDSLDIFHLVTIR